MRVILIALETAKQEMSGQPTSGTISRVGARENWPAALGGGVAWRVGWESAMLGWGVAATVTETVSQEGAGTLSRSSRRGERVCQGESSVRGLGYRATSVNRWPVRLCLRVRAAGRIALLAGGGGDR